MASQVGSDCGKAYLLSVVNDCLKSKPKTFKGSLPQSPEAIILVPTKQVAEMCLAEANKLLAKAEFKAMAIFGGCGVVEQQENIRKGSSCVLMLLGILLYNLSLSQAVAFSSPPLAASWNSRSGRRCASTT